MLSVIQNVVKMWNWFMLLSWGCLIKMRIEYLASKHFQKLYNTAWPYKYFNKLCYSIKFFILFSVWRSSWMHPRFPPVSSGSTATEEGTPGIKSFYRYTHTRFYMAGIFSLIRISCSSEWKICVDILVSRIFCARHWRLQNTLKIKYLRKIFL